jgi:hypothetical protein
MNQRNRFAAAALAAGLLALPAAASAAEWRLTAATDDMADLVDQTSFKAGTGWTSATVLRVQKEPIMTGATHVVFVEYFDCKGWRVGIKQIDAYNGGTALANVTNTDAEVTWKPMNAGTLVDADAQAVCKGVFPNASVVTMDHSQLGPALLAKLKE